MMATAMAPNRLRTRQLQSVDIDIAVYDLPIVQRHMPTLVAGTTAQWLREPPTLLLLDLAALALCPLFPQHFSQKCRH